MRYNGVYVVQNADESHEKARNRKYKYFCVARKYFFSLLENVLFNLVSVGIS